MIILYDYYDYMIILYDYYCNTIILALLKAIGYSAATTTTPCHSEIRNKK